MDNFITNELDINNNGIFDYTNKDNRIDYTPTMKVLIKLYKKIFYIEKQNIYVFLLNLLHRQRQLKGYMPFNKQFAFVFTQDMANDAALACSVSHEIAHVGDLLVHTKNKAGSYISQSQSLWRAFNLRHTFSLENKHIISKGTTDDLMDYPSIGLGHILTATALYKYQWDYIHNPQPMLFAWAEEEVREMAGGKPGTYIKKLSGNIEISPIVRTAEELFSTTIKKDYASNPNSIYINANFYDVSYAGILHAVNGNDPVKAEETSILGYVVYNNKLISSDSKPLNFYIASNSNLVGSDDLSKVITSGQGNPPTNVAVAFGRLGPLIINGLPYGTQNLYKEGAPADAPLIGEPPTNAKDFLIQRSSAKYTSFYEKGNSVGKTIIGVSKTTIYIIVQEHGSGGYSLNAIRDYLIKEGCVHAVFFDGSDSSMLFESGNFLVKQGENKDDTCVVGIRFLKK